MKEIISGTITFLSGLVSRMCATFLFFEEYGDFNDTELPIVITLFLVGISIILYVIWTKMGMA